MHRTLFMVSTLLVVALLGLTGAAVAADESPEERPAVETIEGLTELLSRLEQSLAGLDRPAAERLEARLGEAIEALEGLVERLESADEEQPVSPGEVMELSLVLHRLLFVLEEVAQPARDAASASEAAKRAEAADALASLRAWVSGYVAAATAGMSPRDAAQFERAAREMTRSLTDALLRMARRAEAAEPQAPRLSLLVERLEVLSFRLDGLILRRLREAEGVAP
ncbi:MAG: hypothetical protein AB1778_02715 [Candidatus Bipolaricaulota bacterium]